MTLGDRLKNLRCDLGLSQDALGSQGFVSTPGWIKIENGQRQASEKLLENMLRWLVAQKHVKSNASAALREELLTLRYMGSSSTFVRSMAKAHASTLPTGDLLLKEEPAGYRAKPKRGRPPKVR